MLEEMPKWGVLRDVLEEVQAERRRLAASDDPVQRKAAAAPVVVMAQEAHTCAQLREVGRCESPGDLLCYFSQKKPDVICCAECIFFTLGSVRLRVWVGGSGSGSGWSGKAFIAMLVPEHTDSAIQPHANV